MFFTNLKNLEKSISNELLTDDEGVKYFVSWLVYGSAMHVLSSALRLSSGFYDGLAGVFIYLILVPYLYKLNKKIDNKDFFKRFIAISFVTSIKLLLWYLPIGLIMIQLWDWGHPPTKPFLIFGWVSLVAMHLYYILTVTKSFRRLKILIEGNKSTI